MFDTILGLPVHALVVHAVVVLVPLAAFGAALIAVVPRWRRAYGPVVVAIATAGLAMVPVATRSGGHLEDRLNASGVIARQINRHQDIGNLVIWPTLALWVLTIVLVVLDRRGGTARDNRSTRRTTGIVAVLVLLAAIAAGAVVAEAGHRGSTAVWSCTIQSSACK